MEIWHSHSPEEKFGLQVRTSVAVNIGLKIDCGCKDWAFYT